MHKDPKDNEVVATAIAPLRWLKRILRWLFASIRGVILCAVVATLLLVAMTHTLGWAFALTNTILQTGLRIATISAQATTDIADLRARNEKLNADLKLAHDGQKDAQRQLYSEKVKTKGLENDLKRVRGDLADSQSRLKRREAEVAQLSTDLVEASKPRRVTYMGKQVTVREATQETIASLRRRTKQTAATNATSVFGESIPFFGIAMIVAATSFEVAMACKNMDDLYELQIALDPDSKIADDRDEVCGLQVPTRKEIWERIKTSPGMIWEETKGALKASGAAISNLPTPDFSGVWQTVIGFWDGAAHWLGSWFE